MEIEKIVTEKNINFFSDPDGHDLSLTDYFTTWKDEPSNDEDRSSDGIEMFETDDDIPYDYWGDDDPLVNSRLREMRKNGTA